MQRGNDRPGLRECNAYRPGRETFALAAAAFFACLAIAAQAVAQTQAAVEYYYADWDYYFETSFPDEIAILDGGAFGGVWRRTGQTFTVWSQPASGSSSACRFFSTSFAPKSSHFYTPFDSECATVKNNPDWQFEAIAFHLGLPDPAGTCPVGTKVLYRLYNNGMGGAPNHRYTTSLAVFNHMKDAGWIFEGNGLTGAFACVPLFEAQGTWAGTTSDGTTVSGIVLDDASYYFAYTLPGGKGVDGLVQGTMSSANRQFNSSDGRNFAIGMGVTNTTLAGAYVPRASMNGTVSSASFGTSTFALVYQPIYERPANIAAAVGSYSGNIGTAAGIQNATMTISSSGVVAGTFSNCSLAGSVRPHGSVDVFDLFIATQGDACTFGGRIRHTGIAYYDASNKTLFATAPNPSRNDGFLFFGTKP